MEAIILAGGFGTRLQSIISDVPKPMAPINGQPFLEILLASLSSKGFRRVILSVGYKAQVIVQHFGKEFAGLLLEYEIETSPLGTGGAIAASMAHCSEDKVYVLNGDTFLDFDINKLEMTWSKYRRPIIVGRKVLDTARYGALIISGDRVCGFNEKGQSGPGMINAGCYLLPVEMQEALSLPRPFSFEGDFLINDVLRQPYFLSESSREFIDIGIPEDYNRAQLLF